MTTLAPRVRTLFACALGVAFGLSVGVPAVAQQPAPPPPVRQAPAPASPAVAPPVQLPPPPAPSRTAVAANRAPTPAVVRPMTPVSPPPDSVRPAAARMAAAAPANAVAMCADGSFIVLPGTPADCASHRGLRAAFAQRTPPPAVPPRAAPAPLAAVAAVPVSAPPAGATMHCKDGTYLFGAPAPGRCDANGGLTGMLPATRSAPPPPPQQRRP